MYTNNIRLEINLYELTDTDGKTKLVCPEIKMDVDVDAGYDMLKLRNFKHALSEFISVKLSDVLKRD